MAGSMLLLSACDKLKADTEGGVAREASITSAPSQGRSRNVSFRPSLRAPEEDVPRQLADRELWAEAREVFNLFDKEGRGAIDPKEVRAQMSALGLDADNATIYQLISDLDSDGSQMLELEEFMILVTEHLDMNSEEYLSRRNISEVFEFMDHLVPSRRSGTVELSDLRRLADAVGDNISDVELRAMLQAAKAVSDGGGVVDEPPGGASVVCGDFYQLMTGRAGQASSSSSSSSDDDETSQSPPHSASNGQMVPSLTSAGKARMQRKSDETAMGKRSTTPTLSGASGSPSHAVHTEEYMSPGSGDVNARIARQAALVARRAAASDSAGHPDN